MQARAVAAHCFQDLERSLNVGPNKRGGIVERVVVVGLGGEVHHHIRILDEGVNGVAIGDVAYDEFDPIQSFDRGGISRVSELVENDDVGIRVCRYG